MDNSNNNNPSNNPLPQPLPNSGENPQTPNLPAPPSTPSPWDPNPVQPQPTSSVNTTPQDLTPSGTPTYSPAPQPLDSPPVDTSPIQPSTYTPLSTESTQPVTSPLDNPWGAPTQPPPIDGSTPMTQDAVDTFSSPPKPQPETTPPWFNQNSPSIQSADQGLENPKPPNPFEGEPAPTDLSHLINNNAPPESTKPAGSEAETVVAPANGVPEVPTVPTEGHKGFPKWLIGVGVGLLIIVTGVSAYFILGIGQSPKQTTSIPAETAPVSQQVKPPAPIPTPVVQPTPTATGSANFGQLQGSGTQQATRAADLIRQPQ
ncbi:hypothetical protein HYS96_02060 [Candidatus Daviesbacteria bacterium]|nr:hypothetical protein [Candidatus Daviesbacteria bacterium]